MSSPEKSSRSKPITLMLVGGSIAIGLVLALVTSRTALAPSGSASSATEARAPSKRELPSSVPRFGVQAAVPAVQNDPAAPNYDAKKLATISNASVSTVFGSEPKDPTWAPAMERYMTSMFETDLRNAGVAAKVREMECHTATCRVTIEAQDLLSSKDAYTVLSVFNPTDGFMNANIKAEPPGEARVYYFIFSHDDRNVEDHRKWYYDSGKRKRLLEIYERIRSRYPNLKPIAE